MHCSCGRSARTAQGSHRDDASSMRLAAVEALSRFEPNYNSPAELFATATRCGLDRELEMLAIRAALCQILVPPSPPRHRRVDQRIPTNADID